MAQYCCPQFVLAGDTMAYKLPTSTRFHYKTGNRSIVSVDKHLGLISWMIGQCYGCYGTIHTIRTHGFPHLKILTVKPLSYA